MSNKEIKTRVQMKNDTPEAWQKVSDPSKVTNVFIPLLGEPIFYREEDGEGYKFQMKVGDGERTPEELPFMGTSDEPGDIPSYTGSGLITVSGSIITTNTISKGTGTGAVQMGNGQANGAYSLASGTNDKSVIEGIVGSTIANAINVNAPAANNTCTIAIGPGAEANSTGSNAIGVLATAGVKGYYYTNITFNNDAEETATITISTNRSFESAPSNFKWAKGDRISLVNDAKYPACAEIKSVSGNKITVTKLPFTSVVDLNTLSTLPDDRTIFACYKLDIADQGITGALVKQERWYPREGTVELGWASNVFGVENLGTGAGSFVFGFNNWQAGDFGMTLGRDNISGYGSLTYGGNNDNSGTNSLVGGTSNVVTSNQSIVGGSGNNVQSGNVLAEGANHSVTDGSSCTVVGGDTNVLTKSWCSAVFGNKNTNSGSFSLVSGQNNTITNSNGVAVSGIGNTVGANNVVAGGTGNTVTGVSALVSGSNNNVAGGNTVVGGSSNTVENGNAAVFGANHSVTDSSSCVVVAGDTNTLTKAWCAAVFGNKNVVNGNFSLIAGSGNNSTQHCNVVGGESNTITGNDSAIFGQGNKSGGSQTFMCSLNGTIAANCGQSSVFGENNHIGSDTEVTLPNGTTSTKTGIIDSLVTGKNNKIYASYSIAGGQGNTIWNGNSAVFGYDNQAQGASTIIAGDHNIANTYCQAVFGIYNDNTVTNGDLFVVGNGSSSKRSNALRVTSGGNIIAAGGATFGGNISTTGKITAGMEPTEEMDLVTLKYFNENKGGGSTEIDWSNIQTISVNKLSVTTNTTYPNILDGDHSAAIGRGNHLKASQSLSVGWSNTNEKWSSVTMGDGLTASEGCQVVTGKNNVADSKAAFVIGWGSSASSPKNIFVVKNDGSARVAKCTGESNDEVVNVGYLKNYLLDKEW